MGLNVEANIIKILKENIVWYFQKPEVGKDFSDKTKKA